MVLSLNKTKNDCQNFSSKLSFKHLNKQCTGAVNVGPGLNVAPIKRATFQNRVGRTYVRPHNRKKHEHKEKKKVSLIIIWFYFCNRNNFTFTRRNLQLLFNKRNDAKSSN